MVEMTYIASFRGLAASSILKALATLSFRGFGGLRILDFFKIRMVLEAFLYSLLCYLNCNCCDWAMQLIAITLEFRGKCIAMTYCHGLSPALSMGIPRSPSLPQEGNPKGTSALDLTGMLSLCHTVQRHKSPTLLENLLNSIPACATSLGIGLFKDPMRIPLDISKSTTNTSQGTAKLVVLGVLVDEPGSGRFSMSTHHRSPSQ